MIAGHEGGHVVSRQDTQQKPRRGAAIAHVQHLGGFGQTANPDTGHSPIAGTLARYLHAQCPKRCGGGMDVIAFQQSCDARLSDRKPTQHQGAMGDRFIAGHIGGAFERF